MFPGMNIDDILVKFAQRCKKPEVLEEINTLTLAEVIKRYVMTPNEIAALPLELRLWLEHCDFDPQAAFETPANFRAALLGRLGRYPVEATANPVVHLFHLVLGHTAPSFQILQSSPPPGPPGSVEILVEIQPMVVALVMTAAFAAETKASIEKAKDETADFMQQGDRAMAAMLRSPAILVAGGLSAAQALDLQSKYARVLDARNARNKSGDEIFKVIADAPAAVQASFLKYATSKNYIASGSAAQCRSLARRSGHAFCFYD
jgi:hypothetical protein